MTTTEPMPQPTGPSVADIMSRIDQIAVGGLDQDAPQPIGGYVGPAHAGSSYGPGGPAVAMTGPTGATPVQQQLEGQAAVYMEGDERLPAGYAVEDIAVLQKAMANAGLLTGKIRVGIWDRKSRNAFSELLGFANQQRMEWTDALNVYASSPELGGSQEDQFRPGRFLPKDPAQYRMAVRQMFRDALGRDPDSDELEQYEAELRTGERQAFRSAKGQFGEVVESGGEMSADEFSGLQGQEQEAASARFVEKFEQRIAPEVEFQDSQRVNAEQGGLLNAILGSVDEVA